MSAHRNVRALPRLREKTKNDFRRMRCLPLPESHTKIISICSDGASPNSTAPIVRGPTPGVREPDIRHAQRREVENMNIPPAEQPRGRTSLDEYGRGAESDCARAMAEIERVLHELALTRRSSRERSSPANEAPKAPSLVPAPSPTERLPSTRAWISSSIRMG